MEIILASTSPYRQRLLERLQIRFRCLPPQIGENRLPGEEPMAMAGRLALEKAMAVAKEHPEALIIGSDQVASTNGEVMGKPGNHETARRQLLASSGQRINFYTGVALVRRITDLEKFHVEPFSVLFRELDDNIIENYLDREQPYDCAGSFKCEGLGIALFQGMEGADPTSLEGLPLIALTGLLADAGVPVLGSPAESVPEQV